jgi:hypothetical protein
MRFKWSRSKEMPNDVDLIVDGRKFAGWISYSTSYKKYYVTVFIAPMLRPSEFVTLREAMRYLRRTTAVLIIGGHYEL